MDGQRRLQNIGDTEAAEIFLAQEEGESAIEYSWAKIAPEACPRAFCAADFCFTCSTAGCLGGELCDVGYELDACSSCAEGYFLFPGDSPPTCRACPESAWVTMVAIAGAFLLVCAVIYRYGHSTEGASSAGVLITHMQLVASFTLFQIPWPKAFKDFTAWLGALFSFKLDFVAHPECAARLSHVTKWLLFLSTPLAFVVVFGAWWAVHWARAKCFSWRLRRGRADPRAPLARKHKKAEEAAHTKLIVVEANCLRSSVQCLFILYIFLVQQSAQAFDCSFVDGAEDAPPVLDSNPSIKCEFSDGQWVAMLIVGGAVFVVVGLVMPWRLQRKLRLARDDPQVYNDPRFQALYGWMLRKYSGERYYWEIVVTWRKLLISIIFLLSPVKILPNTFFQIERAALHSYGPDPHSCCVLCNFMTGTACSSRGCSSGACARAPRSRTRW